jgi:hypothetical protein
MPFHACRQRPWRALGSIFIVPDVAAKPQARVSGGARIVFWLVCLGAFFVTDFGGGQVLGELSSYCQAAMTLRVAI